VAPVVRWGARMCGSIGDSRYLIRHFGAGGGCAAKLRSMKFHEHQATCLDIQSDITVHGNRQRGPVWCGPSSGTDPEIQGCQKFKGVRIAAHRRDPPCRVLPFHA
jgi:hypothetical protein